MGWDMTTKLLAVLSSLLFAACAASPTVESPEGRPASEAEVAALAKVDDGQSDLVCERIVETEGPCAVACDKAALREYIPFGTCALFLCTLDDGTSAHVGGCNQ
jgi:hypothetical protein